MPSGTLIVMHALIKHLAFIFLNIAYITHHKNTSLTLSPLSEALLKKSYILSNLLVFESFITSEHCVLNSSKTTKDDLMKCSTTIVAQLQKDCKPKQTIVVGTTLQNMLSAYESVCKYPFIIVFSEEIVCFF